MPAILTPESAISLVRAGAIGEALRRLQSLYESHGPDSATPLPDEELAGLVGALVDCRLARGDLAAAMALGEDAVPLLSAPRLTGALAHLCHGDLATALGDDEAAVEHYLAAGRLAPDAGPDVLPWRAGAALACLRNREPRAAAELAREHLALARHSGSPYAVAGALRTLAAVDPGPDREQHLIRARAVLAGHRAERLAAQIDTDLAGLLVLSHTPASDARALDLLRSAEEYAGRHELAPLQARVRRLLERLGEPPRKARNEAMSVLTASERRVARLAASGLTNRQIAAELLITVKAVEWHLSHVYRKLGISSRLNLAAALGT